MAVILIICCRPSFRRGFNRPKRSHDISTQFAGMSTGLILQLDWCLSKSVMEGGHFVTQHKMAEKCVGSKGYE